MTGLTLHNSSLMRSNMVITCQLLSEIEFTGGFGVYCKLLEKKDIVLPAYSDNIVNMRKESTLK